MTVTVTIRTMYGGTCVVSRELNDAISVELSHSQADWAISCGELSHHTAQRVFE